MLFLHRLYKLIVFPLCFKEVWCGLQETRSGLAGRHNLLVELFPEYKEVERK